MRENAKHMLDPDRKINGEPVLLQQPKLLTGAVMRLYQVEGIEWLRVRKPNNQVVECCLLKVPLIYSVTLLVFLFVQMLWENGINGILADEMGLGKTIQSIGHIAMMVEKKVLGPFLVVAPLSTLPNWINEFRRFTPEVNL